MNRNDLFAAIGGADDRYLLQSEKQKSSHRILFRVGIAAACAAVLCGTAMAIPPIRNAILGISTEEVVPPRTEELTYHTGETVRADYPGHQEVNLTLSHNESTPDRIQTFYLPKAALNWVTTGIRLIRQDKDGNTLYGRGEDGLTISADINFDRQEGQFILFEQHVIPKDEDYRTFIPLDQAEAAVQDELLLNGQPVTRFTFGDAASLFWSDGNYLFCLTAWGMEPEVYLPLVELTEVSDLTPYVNDDTYAHEPEHHEIAHVYQPDYIPEGFEVVHVEGSSYPASSAWNSADGYIALMQYDIGTQITTGEGAENLRWVDAGGKHIMLYDLSNAEAGALGGMTAVWDDGEYLFELSFISPSAAEDEMLRIIESLK